MGKGFAVAGVALAALFSAQPALADPLAFDLNAPAVCQAVPADEVVLVVDGQRTPMRYINAQVRTAARALGFGGVAQYAVLAGNRAIYRLPNAQPTFVVAAPSNIQPQGLFTIASFQPRPNGTREVLIGGGYMSYSTGIAAERIVQTQFDVAPSQAGAPAGMTLYNLTPVAPIPAGEYALIIATGQQGAMQMGGPMAGRFYDFGVD